MGIGLEDCLLTGVDGDQIKRLPAPGGQETILRDPF